MPADGAEPYALLLDGQLLGRFAASSLGDAPLANSSRGAAIGEVGFELRNGTVTTSELQDWQLLAQNRGANAYRHDVIVARSDEAGSVIRWGFVRAFPTFFQPGAERDGPMRVAIVRFVAESVFTP